VIAGAWVVVRTALEDAMLRRELPGYAQYATRVGHRLVPGLW
jgi:protein-S-isoprenylcysteine O-methyltransferase Ste14